MTPSESRIPAELLNECCQRLQAGDTVGSCLASYPSYAPALQPLLETVTLVRELRPVPARDPAVAMRKRAEFVAAAYRLGSEARNQPAESRLAAAWRRFVEGFAALRPVPVGLAAMLAFVLLLGVLTTGAVTASAGALPGDPLYQVKLVAEEARLLFTFDPAAHQALSEQFSQRRLLEARQVVSAHRRVSRMQIAGVLDSMDHASWRVAGLTIVIGPETTITGRPEVGALVRGEVQSPGNGQLIGLDLFVERPAPGSAPVVATATATHTATATPRPTETATPPPATVGGVAPTVWHGDEPLGWDEPATATPTSTPTATASATRTRPATATATPWPTAPRPAPPARIIEYVKSIAGDLWTIGPWTVETDGNTQYIDTPVVGDLVEAQVVLRPDGSALAVSIRAIRRPAPTPEPWESTGVVRSMGAGSWNIGGATVTVGADTVIDAGIAVGDYVTVRGERRANGEIHAKRIIRLDQSETEFSGPIELIAADHWVVIGHTVYIDAQTQISGASAAVGRWADVRALDVAGRLTARAIYVRPDTATPTPTDTRAPTRTPTGTPTPAPTVENTVTPTATAAAPTATATATPGPTLTATATAPPATPTPTTTAAPTAAPTVTATATPEPTTQPAAATHTPTATAGPSHRERAAARGLR